MCGVYLKGVGGLKEDSYIGSCEDVERIVSFPRWRALSPPLSHSFMSLKRCLSHSDSTADCLRVIYAVIMAVL